MTLGRETAIRKTMIREPAMPGRKWYWVAGAVVISAVTAFVFLLLSSLSGFGDDMQQMKAPGTADYMFNEPGRYTVFHEHESIFDGAYYSSPDVVSGLEVSVEPSGGGAPIVMNRTAMNASYQVDGRSGKSIFDFDIVEPGSYRVVARYGDGRTGPTIILAIGRDFTGGLLILVFSALGIMFLGLGGGAAIAIITYLTRERALSAQKGSK